MKAKLIFTLTLGLFFLGVNAQQTDSLSSQKYIFTPIVSLKATPVKDQASSGTCWSYATTSFLESELLRKTGVEYNLSEMFFARDAYAKKTEKYMRYQGTFNFGQGGQAHDVLNTIREKGMMADDDYSGLSNGQTKPAHSEMEAVLKAIVETLAKNPNGKLSPNWMKIVESTLDVYFGAVPQKGGVSALSAIDFAKKTGINPDDYVEITSYTHHPFYTKFVLEIPDNWSNGSYYNVPVDELMDIIKYSLNNGYTVDWDGDVSDKGFSHSKGMAILPDITMENMTGNERAKWEKLSENDRRKQLYTFEKIVPERKITQETRQVAFDNYSATDDHLMHLTGMMKDQVGTIYFITKNSWGTENNPYGGYLNMSETYARLNTIAIMVNKKAIPAEIRNKLDLK